MSSEKSRIKRKRIRGTKKSGCPRITRGTKGERRRYMEYSEEEILQIIRGIARKVANKYTFGYYDKDDIEQEAVMMGYEALARYDKKRPLENFLYVHINNRLKTFKRDNYFRMKNGEAEGFQKIKKNLIDAIPIELSEPLGSDDLDEELDLKAIREKIDEHLPANLRRDYLRIISGAKVSTSVRERVINAIREIFNG